MRINKYLALCGIASRRACDQLITDGKVMLNGRLLKELGKEINPKVDIVIVEGKRVKAIENHVYLMLNKPKGYVCTTNDDKERRTVLDLIKDCDERIFPIGRLDYDTEGLLLLTTDGDFTNLLTHPSNQINKTYIARIKGVVAEDDLNKIRAGVVLDGIKTKPCKAKVLELNENFTRVEVVLQEGRNRQIRRMFESIGKEVVLLKRVAMGEVRLGGLPRGASRNLTEKEISYFKGLDKRFNQ